MTPSKILFALLVSTVIGLSGFALLLQRRRAKLANKNIYGTGLDRKEWTLLQQAVLCAGECPDFPSRSFDSLPQNLKSHAVGQIVARCLANEPNVDLEDAAKLMVGGQQNAWLALSKS